MTFAAFMSHFHFHQNKIPASVAAQIRREAKARLIARFEAGRADAPLCFLDLAARVEAALSA